MASAKPMLALLEPGFAKEELRWAERKNTGNG
jgi:hypothetical protein